MLVTAAAASATAEWKCECSYASGSATRCGHERITLLQYMYRGVYRYFARLVTFTVKITNNRALSHMQTILCCLVLLALPEEHSSLRTEGKDFVITSPGGATLTLSAPTTAEVGCSGAAVQAVDGVCVPRVPACTGDTVTVVNGACVAKDSTVDSTTAGYIQRLVDEKLGQRLEELVDERLLSVTSRIDMVESTDAWQNTTIDHIAAKFHPSTQWECAQITAYAGACRAEVGSQSAFLTYVEAGISGTDACGEDGFEIDAATALSSIIAPASSSVSSHPAALFCIRVTASTLPPRSFVCGSAGAVWTHHRQLLLRDVWLWQRSAILQV